MEKKHDHDHDYAYAKEAMRWYGWGSPVGLSLGISLLMVALGAMVWLLHLAGTV